MTRQSARVIWWILGVIAGLVGAIVIYRYCLLDWEGQPVCHKQVDLAFRNSQTIIPPSEFPNVDGSSAKSLARIERSFGDDSLPRTYMYVPGLRRKDPGDLVLMYLNKPTRWTWHGTPPTVFTAKAWILVPVDMKFYSGREGSGPGEFSERVTFVELRERLLKTLDFLRENDRPNWEAVVEEHTKFLETIEKQLQSFSRPGG